MERKTTLNSCAGEGCHAGCIHLTHVEDGKITKLEKLTYPDGEQDLLCLKGQAGARWPYHTDRLKYPLKRVGQRGKGKWERITWEQALDEIADKITKIRDKYGPAAVTIVPGANSVSPLGGIQHILLGNRLLNLLEGTSVTVGIAIDSNPAFAAQCILGASFGHYMDPRVLIEGKTKYMINWGHNPAEMGLRFWKYIREAQAQDAKLVDIGLIYDPTAKAADWWIPVKAGSDGALALAMIHVIIREALYDEEYLTRYTNGPFLVRTDNGELLRESDISPEGSPENYVVWDITGDQPQAITPHTYETNGIKPALSGTYQLAGIECKPAFQLLADLANEHPPKEVEEITGVSSETIETLTREFAKTKPAALLVGFGLRYMNSGNAYRAIYTLAALTGNIGVLGGGVVCGLSTCGPVNAAQIRLNDFPIVLPTNSFARGTPLAQIFQGMITGQPYPIKAMIAYAYNFVHTWPNPQRWIDKVIPNLELIVVNDIFMTATAEYADYVLPDCTLFEREDMTVGYGGYIVHLDKAIDPMYDCRPPIYFWSELARRLGFGEYFDKSIDEWIEMKLNSDDPSVAGIEPPLTLERLKKEKIIRANVPREPFQPLLDKKFPTPSGRIEIYNEELIPAGDALPVFREQLESPRSALAKRYPLVFNTCNNIYFVHSNFANDPLILERYKKEPHLSINPEDAQKRNISDGDVVIVWNDRGNCKVKAMVSETVPQGVVHIPHGWWPKQFIEGHLQNLVLPVNGPETKDKAREIRFHLAGDRLSFYGFPEISFTDYPDVIFDCLCEVKRAEDEAG